jgi:hypothetical protein
VVEEASFLHSLCPCPIEWMTYLQYKQHVLTILLYLFKSKPYKGSDGTIKMIGDK